MNKRRVVVTGVGVIASNGIGKDEFWRANKQGKSGISMIDTFDMTHLDTKIAGQVRNFDPAQYMPGDLVKKTDRFVHLGLSAAKMAVDDSKIDFTSEDKDKVGVIIGSGLGGVMFHEEQMMACFDRGSHRLNPLAVPKVTPNAVSSHIAIYFGLVGPNMVISTACASGTHAVGEAFRKVQYGDVDVCVTGGAEAPITQGSFGAYCALRVLSKRNDIPQEASRPFDKNRDGFVMSEGAGMLILEELDHAQNRGAHIYAEVVGYAANSGAHHIVMPDSTGKDATRVMKAALKDAGLEGKGVDYINAHATSTSANDSAETKAIKEVFGAAAYQIPVSSTKSMIGHSIGAAGGIEAVVSVLSIEDQFIPPTINLSTPDPDCDLDYVPNQGRESKVNTVLSNSFGFGNCNACLIFQKLKG